VQDRASSVTYKFIVPRYLNDLQDFEVNTRFHAPSHHNYLYIESGFEMDKEDDSNKSKAKSKDAKNQEDEMEDVQLVSKPFRAKMQLPDYVDIGGTGTDNTLSQPVLSLERDDDCNWLSVELSKRVSKRSR